MYHVSAGEVIQKFRSSPDGLTAQEAQERLVECGPNKLRGKKHPPVWVLFLNQFREFMTLILMAAAIISGIAGDVVDTLIILVILFLNAVLGFVQEYRAEKAMDALRRMTVTQARVIRDGHQVLLSSEVLVPGDVVMLEAGNVVAADLRLLEVFGLRIDESVLTGESIAVDKISEVIPQLELLPGDQLNMAFKGTLVTQGRGMGVVVATGMQTEFGKIAGLLDEGSSATPLQLRMTQFGKSLSYAVLLICAVLFISGLIRGEDPFSILLLSVSLAVAAIPEALPALITIALSRGAARLAVKQALVRRLPAVETLGSVTFICSDKTGTITQNKMKVVEKVDAGDWDHAMLKTCMALNHDVTFDSDLKPQGESTELALVQDVIDSIGIPSLNAYMAQFPRIAELPFDSDRKCMSTIHGYKGHYLIVTKGASESILEMLNDPGERDLLSAQAELWASGGKRVLAYAYRESVLLPEPLEAGQVERGLTLAGLTALIDPPGDQVHQAIQDCLAAGIRPVMITGDHPATARAIAAAVGIFQKDSILMTGAELKRCDEESFVQRVEQVSVYARVSPDQKLRIVRALQSKGHFVAMTGDGVNDAPSLKAANIGVAMGLSGTEVSKEAADIVLLDDHFDTIVKAVKEGRRIFDNIRKFVKYIMTCNGAEVWTIFLAPLLGMPIPLLPIHILWINLVTDGLPALALANEKAEADVMRRPPRPPGESLFAGGVGYHIVWVGLLMAGVTLATQAWALSRSLENWQTMVFSVLAFSQLGHVLAVRSDVTFLYRQGFLSNLPLLLSVLITLLMQLGVIYLPFMNQLFHTAPLTLGELSFCMSISLIVFHAVELEKWMKSKLVRN